MKTMRVMEAKQCAICERTLLVGEQPLRFAPDGMDEFRRGLRALPGDRRSTTAGCGRAARSATTVRPARRRRPLSLASIFGDKRRPAAETIVAEPSCGGCRARSDGARGGAGSSTRATRCARSTGSRRSLGEPQASIVVLSGPEPGGRDHARVGHLLVPVPVSPDASQPVRPGRRGPRAGRARREFTDWNAHFEPGTGFSRISRVPSRPGRLHSYDEVWVGRR